MLGPPQLPRPAWLGPIAVLLALFPQPAPAAPANPASTLTAPAARPAPTPAPAPVTAAPPPTSAPSARPANPTANPTANPSANPSAEPPGETPTGTPAEPPTGPRTNPPGETPTEPRTEPPAPGPDTTGAPSQPTTGPRGAATLRPPAALGEIPPQPPRDPNDTPFMRPPNNQPKPTRLRTSPDIRRGYSSVRRVALTFAPVFASFRLPFLCRPSCTPGHDNPRRQHGAGVAGELDVQLIRFVWLRAQGSWSVHPVDDTRFKDDKDNIAVLANAGNIRALGFGIGPVVAIDLGRFLPLIEGGIGGLRVVTPPGVTAGQRGEACINDESRGLKNVCDVGLRCGGGNTCVQSVIPELYFGGAIDILVRKHISLGAQFRYTALLSAPGKFPVYLLGGLRVGVRF